MKVQFWGTRGSIAKAGPSTVRYGGNTSCVEVRSDRGTLVMVDCGTGAHGFGHALVEEFPDGPIDGHILVTHTHWTTSRGFRFLLRCSDPVARGTCTAHEGSASRCEKRCPDRCSTRTSR